MALLICCLLFVFTACGGPETAHNGSQPPAASDSVNEITLTLGAYSVAKDAFSEIIPQFQAYWKAKKGQNVRFQQSYEASGTQARAIAGGFEADVAVLSMEGDIDKIAKAGLITHDWKGNKYGGMVTGSIVVLGTRQGNPLAIRDWADLSKKGVRVLYPNPKTSGGAQWDINAIYGAGLKISEEQDGRKDPLFAKQFLSGIHQHIESLDKSGRASMAAFEYGVGDVIVTYENELLARIKQGVNYEIVVPEYTIQIDNPAAVVDKNAEKHGTREVSEAFIDYLTTPECQQMFVEHGFRPVDPEIAKRAADKYATPAGLFTIDYLGGWSEVRKRLYAKGAVWDQVLAGE